ncbi:MAG: hypothetical protein ACOYNL_01865 [Rickettsiales bacterium]
MMKHLSFLALLFVATAANAGKLVDCTGSNAGGEGCAKPLVIAKERNSVTPTNNSEGKKKDKDKQKAKPATTKPSTSVGRSSTKKPEPTDIPTVDRTGRVTYCSVDETPTVDDGKVSCKPRGKQRRRTPPIILNTSGHVIYPPGTNFIDGFGNIIHCEGLLIIDNTGTRPLITCESNDRTPDVVDNNPPGTPSAPAPLRRSRLPSDKNLPSDTTPELQSDH